MLAAALCLPTSVLGAPWRAGTALGTPDWFALSGSMRVRYETLDEQYRAANTGSDQAVMLRTLLLMEFGTGLVRGVAEFQDSRVYHADEQTPVTTSAVNPAELLQAYIEFNPAAGDRASRIRLGRITMDVGSRRLVARNRFRNTLNAFTGIDANWALDRGALRAFYTLPVQRLVDGDPRDNDPKRDREHRAIRFWGLHYLPDRLPWHGKGEVYLFGLEERDVAGRATRDREILSAGLRLWRPPEVGRFGYVVESVYQHGESRASAVATADLDHRAQFHHLEIGYALPSSIAAELLLQYDYASGDEDPTDGTNQQFDTLFGARRFDFGPTSIYGPFARANLSTPGMRVNLAPRENMTAFVSLRGFWLASADDAWTTARIANPPGQSERYIGAQLEARLRWDLLPGNLRLEVGAAHLFAGDLMDTANKGDTTYAYTQLAMSF